MTASLCPPFFLYGSLFPKHHREHAMIVDICDNWAVYFAGEVWEKAFQFLRTLSPQTEEGRYSIDGDDVYAQVMSYATTTPAKARFEAHDRYIDIQTVLEGSEGIAWSPRSRLHSSTDYDDRKDVQFFHDGGQHPARADLVGGHFAVFFPEDAHMPQLMVAGSAPWVKKVVVKVRAHLYQAPRP